MERFYKGFWRVLSCLLFCSSFAVLSTDLVHLSDDTSSLTIKDEMLWRAVKLQNPDDVTDLINAVHESSTTYNLLLGQKGQVVARIPISTNKEGFWYVMPIANFVDKGMAYWQDEFGNISLIADFSQRDQLNQVHFVHGQAIRLSFTKPENGILWIYMQSKLFPTPANITIQNESEFSSTQLKMNTFTILSISVMLALGVMAFVLFIKTKQLVALFCAGYIGLHGIGWALAAGVIQSFLSPNSYNTTYGGMYLFPFAIAFASYFAFYLFDLNKTNLRIAKILVYYARLSLFLGAVGLFVSFPITFYLTHFLASIWIVLSIYVGTKMLSADDFRAKYFLTGNALYSLSLAYFMVAHALDAKLMSPEIVVLIALAIDCICILLSLSEWLHLKQVEHQKIMNEARFDSLTRVGNRYYLNEKLKDLNDFYLAVFIDCDSIKSINDHQGHAEGDVFLKYVADLMNNKLSNLGQVFRTGGDEFVWICQATSAHQLTLIESNVKLILASIDESVTYRWPKSGISFGIAISTESDSPSNCLSKADERMYQQKSLRKQQR